MHVTKEKCNRSACGLYLGGLFCLPCISVDVSQHCSSGSLPSKEILVVLGLCLVSETPAGRLGLKTQDQVGNPCALLNMHLVDQRSGPEWWAMSKTTTIWEWMSAAVSWGCSQTDSSIITALSHKNTPTMTCVCDRDMRYLSCSVRAEHIILIKNKNFCRRF